MNGSKEHVFSLRMPLMSIKIGDAMLGEIYDWVNDAVFLKIMWPRRLSYHQTCLSQTRLSLFNRWYDGACLFVE